MHAAETRRFDDQPGAGEETIGVRAVREAEADHRTEALHLTYRKRVRRVAREAGIAHAGDRRMLLQQRGDREKQKCLQ